MAETLGEEERAWRTSILAHVEEEEEEDVDDDDGKRGGTRRVRREKAMAKNAARTGCAVPGRAKKVEQQKP